MEYSTKIGIPNSGLNIEVGFKDFGNASYDDMVSLIQTIQKTILDQKNVLLETEVIIVE